MADPTPVLPQRIGEAWRLYHVRNLSVRQVAAEMGVSRGTAHNYIKTAELGRMYVDLLDRAEQRGGQAARLREYLRLLMEQINNGRDVVEVIPVMLGVEKRLADLLGLDAPTRVAVDDGRQPEVRPEVIAAVRAVERAAADERRALERGSS